MGKETWPREELLRRYDADQEARQTAIELALRAPGAPATRAAVEAMLRLDRENTDWLREAVREHGWPRLSEAGALVCEGSCMLAQQTDADFMRHVLGLMEALLPEGEVPRSHVAIMTDRVLLAEGKRQRFGTQCIFDADVGWVARPCEDSANLNLRRAEMGLGRLEAYLIEMGRVFG